LTVDGLVDTLEELNTQLARFTVVYNTERPHRAIGRRTPATVYAATDKAFPVIEAAGQVWRIRYDRVGPRERSVSAMRGG